jgi:hypothetical protein
MGYDPDSTQRGALTIGAVIRELRALFELTETIKKPEPQVWPAMLAPGLSTNAIDAAVAKALAARDPSRRPQAVFKLFRRQPLIRRPIAQKSPTHADGAANSNHT